MSEMSPEVANPNTVGPDYPGVTGAPGEGSVDTDRLEAEQAEVDDEDADDDE